MRIGIHCTVFVFTWQKHSRGVYSKTLVPDDSRGRIAKGRARQSGHIFPSHHGNRFLCHLDENTDDPHKTQNRDEGVEQKLLNMSLTIHLDLECDGGAGQFTPSTESILALLLSIHSLQLQCSVVSDGEERGGGGLGGRGI